MESRAFPAFTYDPSAGPNWASRFYLEANSQVEADWPVQAFCLRGREAPARAHGYRLHPRRFRRQRPALRPPLRARAAREVEPKMIPVDEALRRDARAAGQGAVRHAGGRRRPPAARDRRRAPDARGAALPRIVAQPAGTGRHPQFARGKAAREEPGRNRRRNSRSRTPAAPAGSRRRCGTSRHRRAGRGARARKKRARPTRPTSRRARCTTCNECTKINNKMFAYNENKQAYIANQRRHLRAAGRGRGELPGLDHPSGQAAQSDRAGNRRPAQARRGVRLGARRRTPKEIGRGFRAISKRA